MSLRQRVKKLEARAEELPGPEPLPTAEDRAAVVGALAAEAERIAADEDLARYFFLLVEHGPVATAEIVARFPFLAHLDLERPEQAIFCWLFLAFYRWWESWCICPWDHQLRRDLTTREAWHKALEFILNDGRYVGFYGLTHDAAGWLLEDTGREDELAQWKKGYQSMSFFWTDYSGPLGTAARAKAPAASHA